MHARCVFTLSLSSLAEELGACKVANTPVSIMVSSTPLVLWFVLHAQGAYQVDLHIDTCEIEVSTRGNSMDFVL